MREKWKQGFIEVLITYNPDLVFRFCACFTMDVIAGAAFGLQVDSVKNPQDQFVYHGHNLMFGRRWVLRLSGAYLFSYVCP